jgi:hypothetical protein
MMSTYRLRYLCETALCFEQDVMLGPKDNQVLLLFSRKRGSQAAIHVQVDVAAANYQEANVKAQPVLQSVLNALSFSTGSPLLILHWDFIIKDEAGSKSRRALWCEKLKEPATVQLTQRSIDEAKRILNSGGESSLPLLWHRYAIQRNLIIDRFLFQWLAFEGLSGKRNIPTICPTCKADVTHCEKPLLHEGSDRKRAHALFSQVAPDYSESEFIREIWGRARNSMFHGTRPPDPALLGQLQSLSPKLRDACDREFARLYKLGNEPHRAQDLELHFYKYNMFEWQTANAASRFADDFPWDAALKEFGNMRPGEVRMAFPETWPFKRLNFDTESGSW